MATNFSPSWRSYILKEFPSIVMFGMKGFYASAIMALLLRNQILSKNSKEDHGRNISVIFLSKSGKKFRRRKYLKKKLTNGRTHNGQWTIA